ncbi:MAG: amino acid ABC transporter permease [Clostridia bacterium]|nr:amino acid ABC transporter permease [Clostridia bacterium]
MDFFNKIGELFSTKKYLLALGEGLKTTLIITICALAIGIVLGALLAVVKISASRSKKMKPLSILCDTYITIIRGTPMALQLFIMAFAVFAIRGFPLEITAIITFGLNSGAYVAENLRAGIQSVDKGQMEAGRSLGLSYTATMSKIVLPQAVKNVIPSIGNEMISLLKETSIVSMVGLIDLTFSAKIIGAGQNMSDYLVPMLTTAVMYLIIVYGITLLLKLLERRLKSDKRC